MYYSHVVGWYLPVPARVEGWQSLTDSSEVLYRILVHLVLYDFHVTPPVFCSLPQ